MKLRPLSRAEVREIDRRVTEEFGIPGVVLMENAGREAARWLVEIGAVGPVAICCGKGNNGGDGFVMARHFESWGFDVYVLLLCDPAELRGDARTNYRILEAAGIPSARWKPDSAEARHADDDIRGVLNQAAWIVDGLLGTGAAGEVRGAIRTAIDLINACAAPKLAIDIPSGLDCDTGRPLGAALRATHTATFVAPKVGFTNPAASEYLGEVRVFDIGIPAALLREFRT